MELSPDGSAASSSLPGVDIALVADRRVEARGRRPQRDSRPRRRPLCFRAVPSNARRSSSLPSVEDVARSGPLAWKRRVGQVL